MLAIGGLTAASLCAAANATGEWTGKMPLPDGNTTNVQLVLKASAPDLDGTITIRNRMGRIANGSDNGNRLSFDVVRYVDGHEVKRHFQGTLTGDTMHLTVTREASMRRMGHGPRQFDLQRARH
ncbi:MAG TPA: hypothetical protein VF283_12575 [Bryobacteraceae bacterium]